ncbi:beta-xylosidase [Pseudoduganella flava]|uniref:Beta-xylosidase n=1 Tax=Pseudoduganella flava TaxID=871742 RepID=A0A562PVZ4_9BURK|nr:glycoside hydrolase 43 family protein [Pseudoduganella flava]QGZ39694.1 family 43 glycosylhydrolase [Pseudoduganella flava]TWI48604.1 beta-xylosidase [Pseudoduganella flava]
MHKTSFHPSFRPHRLAAALATAAALLLQPAAAQGLSTATWTPDNGNGTFTNPIFHDEFSDPDIIRVGDWFYLTGTTMHAMPGLPVLRSQDLVNWEFVSYAAPKLDFGPAYRLEDGKSIYGRGIWAPSLRYHDGTFYIFTNVNGRGTQIYSATDPKGPWTHREMKRSLHDLSVLFDDDGKVYVVWDHQEMKLARLTDDLTDIVPGSEKVLFTKDQGMGEGAHLYKIDGKYYILSANYAGGFRMPAARADRIDGPWEVNRSISTDEGFGLTQGNRLRKNAPPFAPDDIVPGDPKRHEATAIHQGGIVLTPAGEWWGFSMMDANSVGRLLTLAPVTWQDGWPYFGLPGNLGRNPRTWVKPKTAAPQPVTVPFQRSDDFAGSALQPVWQWNHVPVDGKWSLAERPGYLRLHALPAPSFWLARNTLTQRAIGPRSTPTVVLDAAGLRDGDVAGLGLLNLPYATLAVEKSGAGLSIAVFDQARNTTRRVPIKATRVWLRADCDFLTEQARFSYSVDGKRFVPLGDAFTMVFQLVTFQGVRYALFNYNQQGREGGVADFDSIDVHQPHPRGLLRPIPAGRTIRLKPFGQPAAAAALAAGVPATFAVRDMGLGRVALQAGKRYLSVAPDGAVTLQDGAPGAAQSFQWIETPTGELVLMALANNRFLRRDAAAGTLAADSAGPTTESGDGTRFIWSQ